MCYSLSTIEKVNPLPKNGLKRSINSQTVNFQYIFKDFAKNSISVPFQSGKRFLLPRKELKQCDSVCQKRSIPVRFHDIKKVVARGARVKPNQIKILTKPMIQHGDEFLDLGQCTGTCPR